MRFVLLNTIQKLFRLLGLQIRRVNKNISFEDAMVEQLRLAGPDIATIVEIGAANGRDTLAYADKAPTAKVFGYEPLPSNFNSLVKAVAGHERIQAFNLALSDYQGEAEFFETALKDASSLLKPKFLGATFDKYIKEVDCHQVAVTTLDAECIERGFEKIDILKMDVQGSELSVLHGAKNMLKNQKIKLLYIEVQFQRLYEQSGLYHDVATLLYGYGYCLHNLYNMQRDQRGRLCWCDAIFVRAQDVE